MVLRALAIAVLVAPSAVASRLERSEGPLRWSSPDGRHVFEVLPVPDGGLRLSAIGTLTRDGDEVWSRSLASRSGPVTALVATEGDRVVLIGDGEDVVAIHGPGGEVVRRFDVRDLLSAEEIEDFPYDDRHRIWWAWGEHVLDEEEGRLVLAIADFDRCYGTIRIDLASGEVVSRELDFSGPATGIEWLPLLWTIGLVAAAIALARAHPGARVAFLLLAIAAPAAADSWALPETIRYSSPDGHHVLEVVPGTVKGPRRDCLGTLLEEGTPIWNRPLVNEVAPVHALVANGGSHAVTFDDWFGQGHGPNVVVLYGPGGDLVRRHALEDLLAPGQIESLPHSVSSIRWGRAHRIEGSELVLSIEEHGTIRIDLATGDVLARDLDFGPSLPARRTSWLLAAIVLALAVVVLVARARKT